ncbi:hypothetical protein O1M54_13780 [Streptomyces diastatochromogenes]|jgi:hypothetical protein|nr:hypothetical protein [Streptomyces diastatochromogenes]
MRSRVLMTGEVAALVQREVAGGAVHGELDNTGVPQWSETVVAATSPSCRALGCRSQFLVSVYRPRVTPAWSSTS